MSTDPVHGLVDHLFRREAGRMVAVLTRSFGPARLDLAEEVVQEALVTALKRWPWSGVPEDPVAWLYRVARNRALDLLRRDGSFRSKEGAIRDALVPPRDAGRDAGEIPEGVHLAGEIPDDQLRLIFLCCHPDLPRDGRVALTLKTVCGFSVPEIARAFLTRDATIAQRVVRAQRRIRELGLPFEVPGPTELPERLDTVLEVLYLLFNEGYSAHAGDALVRADLCHEALRLARHLALRPDTGNPAVHALAALLAFQASRLPARVDAAGDLVRLEDQDRSRWDRGLIHCGFAHLERAAQGREETTVHLEAAIAAQHAAASRDGAPDAAGTDWPAILALYDRLLACNPSPVVALNRAVALARVEGPEAGLAALEVLGEAREVRGYHLLPAIRGDLLRRAGRTREAEAAYREALERPCSEPERRFLERRVAAVSEIRRKSDSSDESVASTRP